MTISKKNSTKDADLHKIDFSYDSQVFDILLHASFGKLFGSLSPAAVNVAIFDWLCNLYIAPAKQFDITKKGAKNFYDFLVFIMLLNEFHPLKDHQKSYSKSNDDPRFKDEAWDAFPFNIYKEGFLTYNDWLNEATTNIRGVTKHHRQVVNFVARQVLDMYSPSNYLLTNPKVLQATLEEGGMNLVRGLNNYLEDAYRDYNNLPPVGTEDFKVGLNIAITPGKVVYKNQLIELIQYEPTTKKVYAEPLLIVPAWIMKYYILDLSQQNSLVKYLVGKGHAVFIISWKNPGTAERNIGFDDYVNLGILNSIDTINKIIPNKKIQAAGYCLGGTLLAITAAYMARRSDDRLKSLTLFAAQVDFKDPGELSFFIDQSQVTYMEDLMWENGYLEGSQMAFAFNMLRSNDLIWSRMVNKNLLGKRRPLNDLMSWNADATRLPYKMHSQYLRKLFLNNDLTYGRFKVNGKRVTLADLTVPIFVVSTRKDHVSPWKSVHKIHLFTHTDITFVLTTGGHNVGIVNEPGSKKSRAYQIGVRKKDDRHISGSKFLKTSPEQDGSWWPAWDEWLKEHSSTKVNSPNIGNAKEGVEVICDAPGEYVLER